MTFQQIHSRSKKSEHLRSARQTMAALPPEPGGTSAAQVWCLARHEGLANCYVGVVASQLMDPSPEVPGWERNGDTMMDPDGFRWRSGRNPIFFKYRNVIWEDACRKMLENQIDGHLDEHLYYKVLHYLL